MRAASVVTIWAVFAQAQPRSIRQPPQLSMPGCSPAAPGNTGGKKIHACFVRHYDADQIARHPKQKVGAMRLLVTAEMPPDDKVLNYSFRLGVNYRHRPGDFDSSGYCNHATATDAGKETRFDCGVDCEGGGISVVHQITDGDA